MNPPDDLNEELMRSIGTRLRDQRFIEQVNKFPLEKPDRIVVTFHEDIYPAPVSDAWLELRLRLNDDLNIVYIEEWSDSHWACRWDRHNNDHNAREHFHPPPRISTDTALDINLPSDPNRVVTIVLEFTEDRISDLWQTAELIYPNEYQFDQEYGPDIWM